MQMLIFLILTYVAGGAAVMAQNSLLAVAATCTACVCGYAAIQRGGGPNLKLRGMGLALSLAIVISIVRFAIIAPG